MQAHITVSAACYTTNVNNVSLTTTSLGAGHYQGQGRILRVVNTQYCSVNTADFVIGASFPFTPPPNTPTRSTAFSLRPQGPRQHSTIASRLRDTPRQAAVAGAARRTAAKRAVRSQEQEDPDAMDTSPDPHSRQQQTKTPEQLEDEAFGAPPPLSLGPALSPTQPPAHDRLRRADLLANSGIITFTDYPLSTSPRGCLDQIHYQLDQRSKTGTDTYSKPVGGQFPSARHYGWHKPISVAKISDGHGFAAVDYQAAVQPRTQRTREVDGEEVSPGTKPVGVQMSLKEREEAEEAARVAATAPPRRRRGRGRGTFDWSLRE